jgi:hypothetical protein
MSYPHLGLPGVLGKLSFEERADAEALTSLIVDDPDAAAYEIVARRAENTRLTQRVAELEERIKAAARVATLRHRSIFEDRD